MRRPRHGPAARLAVGALIAVALLLCGCRRVKEAAAPRTEGSPAAWYVLHEGQLQARETAPGAPAAAATSESRYLPWTLQERVADLLLMGGRLYVAVNGYGVAWAEPPLGRGTRFSTAYDPAVFPGRTLTEMLPGGERLILHLYVDRTLTDGPAPGGAAVSFVAFDPGARDQAPSFVRLRVPFQAAHPDWEAVTVVQTSAEEVAVEWKRTDEERTEFEYTRLRPAEGTESPIDRAAFRGAYGFVSPTSNGVDKTVQALFDAVLRRLERGAKPGRSTAVHLVVRTEGGEPERYRYQPAGYADQEDIDLISVPARRSGGAVWALTPEGTILRAAQGSSEVSSQSLPELPDSYRYTGFEIAPGAKPVDPKQAGTPDRSSVAASWEEVRFTTVGEAGLYIGPLVLPAN